MALIKILSMSCRAHFCHFFSRLHKGTSINDVPCFLAIFDLPTYLVLLYNVPFLGLFWTPLPTLKLDVIYGRSQSISVNILQKCPSDLYKWAASYKVQFQH